MGLRDSLCVCFMRFRRSMKVRFLLLFICMKVRFLLLFICMKVRFLLLFICMCIRFLRFVNPLRRIFLLSFDCQQTHFSITNRVEIKKSLGGCKPARSTVDSEGRNNVFSKYVESNERSEVSECEHYR